MHKFMPLFGLSLFLVACQSGPTTPPRAHVIHLRHARATDLEEVLQQFLQDAQRQGNHAQTQLTADVESNSILVQSDADDVDQVVKLIDRLDVQARRTRK